MSRTSTRSSRAARATKKRAPRRGGASTGRRVWTWTKRIAIGVGVLALVGVVGLAGVFWYYGRDLPTVDALRSYQPPQTTRVVDRSGRMIGEIFTERRTVIPMERIPRVFRLCVLAAEDADFYEHEGLDYPGLVRALGRSVLSGEQPRGTSTITQQVVKLLLLTPERRMSRKIRELMLARQLEQELTKDEILHLYLNHINFGHGRYGVQEAARFYFGKDAEELSLAEASLIAGVPQSPSHLSPRTHPEAARRRQDFVLRQLEEKRAEHWPDLTVEEIQAARDAEVEIIDWPESSDVAPEIVALARETLRSRLSEEDYARGGYTVHTAIDLDLQESVRTAVREGLTTIDERHGYRGPLEAPTRRRRPMGETETLRVGGTYDAVVTGTEGDTTLVLDVEGHPAEAVIPARYNPDELVAERFAEVGARMRVSITRVAEEEGQDARAQARLELGPQGAAVIIEPRSRDVLALVGGYDAVAGFNRAIQAKRQPGSTFKPIVYALGMKQRAFTPASLVDDAAYVYDDGYSPSDFATREYLGHIRLRKALAISANPCAIQVIRGVTPEATVEFAHQLGVESELEPVTSLALGTSEVSVLELTNAYATFAAGGRWQAPRIVTRIQGPGGRDVPLAAVPPPRDVMTPAEAYLITSLMRSVVEEGTGRRARQLGRPVAGKTGTSDRSRDAWFMGFTPELVTGVWVGFDDMRSLGRREDGSRAALPIWVAAMQAAHEGRPRVDFPVPSGIVTAQIDPESGLLAFEGMENAMDEVFLEGTAPTDTVRPPDIADPSTFFMEQVGGGAPTAPSTEGHATDGSGGDAFTGDPP